VRKPRLPETKEQRRPVIQIYLTWPLVWRFRRLAAQQQRSASDYGRLLIEEHLRRQSGERRTMGAK
jgi:hypothetical protein